MLNIQKPITRRTTTLYGHRSIIVRMMPEGIYLKEDGRRWTSAYLVPWGAVYSLGGKLRAQQIKAEKLARRKLRKQGLL